MDTNKMREQFEAALHAQKEFKLSVEAIAAAEWAWQASRDAVVVELPDPSFISIDEPLSPKSVSSIDGSVLAAISRGLHAQVRKSIEAQGLKVAP